MSQTARTELLEIGYEQHGSPTGLPVLLLHGWPDSPRTWDRLLSHLPTEEFCLYTPYLRGYGPTRFLSEAEPRSGQVTALALDAFQFLESVGAPPAIVVGHDWGARLAYVLAALWPEKVRHLLTLSAGYEVAMPRGQEIRPAQGHAYWYQWFLNTDRGEEALRKNPHELCRYLWQHWSPGFKASDEEFAETALAWENPDWAMVTLHSYRFRWAGALPAQRYAGLEARASAHPEITVPTTLLHGAEDGASLPASSEGKEKLFRSTYHRHLLPGVGHFIPREDPATVARYLLAAAGKK